MIYIYDNQQEYDDWGIYFIDDGQPTWSEDVIAFIEAVGCGTVIGITDNDGTQWRESSPAQSLAGFCRWPTADTRWSAWTRLRGNQPVVARQMMIAWHRRVCSDLQHLRVSPGIKEGMRQQWNSFAERSDFGELMIDEAILEPRPAPDEPQ